MRHQAYFHLKNAVFLTERILFHPLAEGKPTRGLRGIDAGDQSALS